MRLQEIRTDRTLRELTPRGTPAFPVAMYQNDITAFATGHVPWHWHQEIEMGYLLRGSLAVEFDGRKATLSPGDGFFVNSNRLHAMAPIASGPCETVNIVFDPEIIAGASHSVYETKYVLPVTANPEIGVVALWRRTSGHTEILRLLGACFSSYTTQGSGFELEVRSLLSQVWILLLESFQLCPTAGNPQRDSRLKAVLTFLHNHYTQPLTLEQIAAAGDLGPRTCCRCFREQLGMTPFGYLLEYRVKMAAELLLGTDRSVTEVCFATGFNDTSYFTRTFRRLTGRTPTQFRAVSREEAP